MNNSTINNSVMNNSRQYYVSNLRNEAAQINTKKSLDDLALEFQSSLQNTYDSVTDIDRNDLGVLSDFVSSTKLQMGEFIENLHNNTNEIDVAPELLEKLGQVQSAFKDKYSFDMNQCQTLSNKLSKTSLSQPEHKQLSQQLSHHVNYLSTSLHQETQQLLQGSEIFSDPRFPSAAAQDFYGINTVSSISVFALMFEVMDLAIRCTNQQQENILNTILCGQKGSAGADNLHSFLVAINEQAKSGGGTNGKQARSAVDVLNSAFLVPQTDQSKKDYAALQSYLPAFTSALKSAGVTSNAPYTKDQYCSAFSVMTASFNHDATIANGGDASNANLPSPTADQLNTPVGTSGSDSIDTFVTTQKDAFSNFTNNLSPINQKNNVVATTLQKTVDALWDLWKQTTQSYGLAIRPSN